MYTGGFPVMFGDRMSSVIDVVSMAPPTPRYHELAVSFFNSSLLSSGTFDKGNGEWVASARRSNLDLWFEASGKLPGRPRYIDAFAKLAYNLNHSLRITGNVLHFSDDIRLSDTDREEQATADYADSYFWLRLDHTPSNRVSGSTLLAYSTLDSRRFGNTDQPGVGSGSVSDRRDFIMSTVQSDWSWMPDQNLVINVGAELRDVSGRYNYADDAQFALLFEVPDASSEVSRSRVIEAQPRGGQYAVYASVRHQTTPRLTLEGGLRWDRQTLNPGHGDQLSPRAGLRYRLGDRTFLRASWERFFQLQGIDELQIEDGVREFFSPQRSDHALLGLEHGFKSGMNLRVEVYSKHMSSLRPRYENLLNTFVILPELKPDRIRIAPTSAMAHGFEALLSRQNNGRLSWWIGYSWSSVKDRIDGVDVPRSWDQTHAVTDGLNWETARWNVGAAFGYRSGWPTTTVVSDDSGVIPVVTAAQRNDDRLHFYRSLDVRVARRFQLERGSLSVFLEVDNIFGHNNTCCVEYEFDLLENGLELEATEYFPTIPSLGFVWQF